MRFEKRERSAPCQCGGLGIVTGAQIAVESVPGAVVPINLNFGMGGANPLDMLGGDMSIELAEVELGGGQRCFIGIVADTTCIITDCD